MILQNSSNIISNNTAFYHPYNIKNLKFIRTGNKVVYYKYGYPYQFKLIENNQYIFAPPKQYTFTFTHNFSSGNSTGFHDVCFKLLDVENTFIYQIGTMEIWCINSKIIMKNKNVNLFSNVTIEPNVVYCTRMSSFNYRYYLWSNMYRNYIGYNAGNYLPYYNTKTITAGSENCQIMFAFPPTTSFYQSYHTFRRYDDGKLYFFYAPTETFIPTED